jgi:hypothetical protein
MAKAQINLATSKKSRNRTSPRSLPIAAKGITTGGDFANLMSALMSDVIGGLVTPGVANAAINAGGKLLKVVELTIRFGHQEINGNRVLRLAAESQPLVLEEKPKR